MIIIRTTWCDTERTWTFDKDGANWDEEMAKHGGDWRLPTILENIEESPEGFDGVEYNSVEWWQEA